MEKWLPEPRLWDVKQASHYLGIATGTLYNLVSAKRIDHVKGSGIELKFLKEQLDSYISKNTKRADRAYETPICKKKGG